MEILLRLKILPLLTIWVFGNNIYIMNFVKTPKKKVTERDRRENWYTFWQISRL